MIVNAIRWKMSFIARILDLSPKKCKTLQNYLQKSVVGVANYRYIPQLTLPQSTWLKLVGCQD